jgi:hypothetical protein
MTRIIIGLLLFIFGGSGPAATASHAPVLAGASVTTQMPAR